MRALRSTAIISVMLLLFGGGIDRNVQNTDAGAAWDGAPGAAWDGAPGAAWPYTSRTAQIGATEPKLNKAQDLTHFEVDPEHTFVTFEVNRFGLVDVVGMFPDVAGTIEYDPEDVSATRADITVQTESVYMGKSEDRYGAVVGPVFLDVKNYPEMSFKITSIENGDGVSIAIGDLTIHGTTGEIRMPFSVRGPVKDPTGLVTISIKGGVTINRQDFGLLFDRRLANGLPFIGNDVKIEINVLAVQG